MGHRCFLLTPVPKIRVWLRRYDNVYPHTPCPAEPGPYSYHQQMFLLGDFEFPHVPEQYEDWCDFVENLRPPKDDPRWPKTCKCGMAFPDAYNWQMFTHRIYERSDNHELTTIQEAPVGAMWYAWWYGGNGKQYSWDWDNQDKPMLVCKTPGGEWIIDSRASNCTMKDDRVHRCWIRHGEVPNITVNKLGHTCAAGAGSIQCGSYHGFLRNGELT